jgi:hypothetical protein
VVKELVKKLVKELVKELVKKLVKELAKEVLDEEDATVVNMVLIRNLSNQIRNYKCL